MAFKKTSKGSSDDPGSRYDKEFWQQLDDDFPFHGVDEEELRQYTEQWATCANELLGPVPSRSKKKAKR
ncbi:hypothetical protein [Leptothoe kymatousa]|uniref:Uncharacterized protein n=1 Tax=Leptothoe kymatousa TAU-MAC 1615 TaxID=2364775 RepID=A0ABS5Y4V2_9CYAN|nr:hypothetical protein [Leptothoe kymatousa]MBT9312857.1 hypothetical protein [Leptothoe kymatousa TAU-MAC 1615]